MQVLQNKLTIPSVSTAVLDISLPSLAIPKASSLSSKSRSSSHKCGVSAEATITNYDIDYQFEKFIVICVFALLWCLFCLCYFVRCVLVLINQKSFMSRNRQSDNHGKPFKLK
jgi:hypothetical protein